MNREDCWMTFSEALERYLTAREDLASARTKEQMEFPREQMKEASEHMDALTSYRNTLPA
jgi:hypothetical protein